MMMMIMMNGKVRNFEASPAFVEISGSRFTAPPSSLYVASEARIWEFARAGA